MTPYPELFPLAEYWWFYVGFVGFVLAVLLLDLGVFHRKSDEVSFRGAAAWSVVWVLTAVVYAFWFRGFAFSSLSTNQRLLAIPGFDPAAASQQVFLEFLTGYVVEKALAADNIFVFAVLFSVLSVPSKHQHRVLFYGILGALLFRGVFISLGAVLISYEWMEIVFGLFLIWTGFKICVLPEKEQAPGESALIRWLRRYVPVTSELNGQYFFTKLSGKWHATPLFVALVCVEVSDVVFAFDSVPAIFAITREPLVVFTSNIFAILGLRAMYFLLASVVEKFHLLKYGLAFVLVFVGAKMVYLNHYFGGKFPIKVSLSVILSVVAASIVASLLFPAKGRAHEPV